MNSKNVLFEIDTDSSMSVISDRLHAQPFGEVPLEKSNTVLKTYDGTCIKPLSAMGATIQHNDRKVSCVFLVFKNGGEQLIGRDILDKIKLDFVWNLPKEMNVNNLTDEFSDIRSDDSAVVETNPVLMHCVENSVPCADVEESDKQIVGPVEQMGKQWHATSVCPGRDEVFSSVEDERTRISIKLQSLSAHSANTIR